MLRQKILTFIFMTEWFLLPFSLSFSQNKSETLVNINNITSWIHGDGFHPYDRTEFGNGAFPKGTGGFIFTEGIVWGGKVNDDRPRVLRVGGNWFVYGCTAGVILPDGSREPDNDETVRPYRVRRDWKTADLRDDAASYNNKQPNQVTDIDVQLLRALYETDWNMWPWEKGAPHIERNGIPGYQPPPPFNDDPSKGPLFTSDSLISGRYDEPGLAGANPDSPADQVVWTVYNDLDESKTLPASRFLSDPIGLEVHNTMWAYNRTDPLGNVIFKRVRIIYKGTATTPADAFIDSMYIAQFADPDNGSSRDDYVGCDTTLSLGYVYNSKTTDGTYFNRFGLPPPAGGFDFLQGPLVPGSPTDSALFDLKYRKGDKNLPMTAFTFFSGSGSARVTPPPFNPGTPTGTWYNLMGGFEPRPEYPARNPLKDHLGSVTKFELTGDPVRGTGDLDGSPTAANPQRFIAGDRAFVMSSGPFTMARGDTQEVVVALVAGLGADYLSSVSVMKFNDRFAQNAYNNLFDLPTMPVPTVTVAELDKEIVLTWGEHRERVEQIENESRGGYRFEGYNVYQLPNATATLEHEDTKKIKTFDLVNDVTVIIDEGLDEKAAVIVTKPVQVGSNSGIQRYLKITRDEIRNTPLVNGQEYHFAVTAYGYNGSPDAASHSLESPLARIDPIPQSPKPGVRLHSAVGDTIKAIQTAGGSDGIVYARVIDPSNITGHDYRITFEVVSGRKVWSLVDETIGKTLISNQSTYGDSTFNPIIDGLQWIVLDPGAAGGINQIVATKIGSSSYSPPINIGRIESPDGNWSIDAQGATNTATLYASLNWRNRVGTSDYEIRFTEDGSTASEYFIGPGGLLNNNPKASNRIPIQVWDITTNSRLILKVLDDNADNRYSITGNNSITSLGNGAGWERIYISKAIPYAEPLPASSPMEASATSVLGRLVIVDWQKTGFFPPPGTIVRIVTHKPITSSDSFSFTTSAFQPTKGNAELAREESRKINVFPNPYFGFNSRETSRLNKYVTFNHLPARAIIRIFNLAGVLVNVLEKDDASQFKKWDLRNHNNLPVASGIYIVHIEMPDLGTTKILKLALVQEEQVLPVY